MKKWLLITILVFSLGLISYSAFCREPSDEQWDEDCMTECLSQGTPGDACLKSCGEI